MQQMMSTSFSRRSLSSCLKTKGLSSLKMKSRMHQHALQNDWFACVGCMYKSLPERSLHLTRYCMWQRGLSSHVSVHVSVHPTRGPSAGVGGGAEPLTPVFIHQQREGAPRLCLGRRAVPRTRSCYRGSTPQLGPAASGGGWRPP